MQRILIVVVAIGVTLASGGAVPALVTADATAEQTITSCTTISEPGYYTLGSNLTKTSDGTCLQIESDDVVLDGAGHTLTGNGDHSDSVGLEINASEVGLHNTHQNVTVRDVRFDSWGTGISLAQTRNVTISNIEVVDSEWGVQAGKISPFVSYSGPTPAYETTINESMFTNSGVDVDAVKDIDIVDNRFVLSSVYTELESDSITDVFVARNDLDTSSIVVGGHLGYKAEPNLSDNVSVRSNDIEDGEIYVSTTQNLTVANNTLAGDEHPESTGIRLDFTRDSLVVNNTVTNSVSAIRVQSNPYESDINATGNEISGNLIRNNGVGVVLRTEESNNVVEGNTIVNNSQGVTYTSIDSGKNGSNYVRGNDIHDNDDGVYVNGGLVPLVIESNDLSGNTNGVRVNSATLCVEGEQGAEIISVHGNDLSDNEAYGVLNNDTKTLNATGNYWGASDGPSSTDDADAPFSDPVTGTLADGNGTAVSENPNDPGTSNVHFDPFLDSSPDNAGVHNETAS